ncbi:MAG: hypothetical protein J0H64_10460 [Actinobacteria bacterium]|nr:hypothetical protein [Actinomycetota bacterium]
MRKTYRVLTLIALIEIIVQAGAVAWAQFGLARYVAEGNTINKAMLECRDCGMNFVEEYGFMVHGMNGAMIIPAIGLILLIVSFFVKNRTLTIWAAVAFVLILIQSQVLPMLSRDMPGFGAVHGVTALALLLVLVTMWIKAKPPVTAPAVSLPVSSATA